MADIVYTLGPGVYINLTNRCPCRCTFCIRQEGDGLGSADNLWHEHQPSTEEVLAALEQFDFSPYSEVVFCGYGEPTCALEQLLAAARWLREHTSLSIRLNTNGLADLIHKKPCAKLLQELVDTVSISLNAPTAERYAEVTQPSFGLESFDAMLQFARDCRDLGFATVLTVVDVIPGAEIAACRELCAELGIPLRVRVYS